MAAPRKSLRAVAPNEVAVPPRRQTVAQAAADGSYRDLLVAMRERAATAVTDPSCPPRDLAALTRRLQEIAREIEGIDARSAEEASEGGAVSDAAWDPQAL